MSPLVMSIGDVVITGVGVVSPIGIGNDAFWRSLCEGQSGVARIDYLWDTVMPVRIGAEVRNFDGKDFVTPRKSMKVMCREIQFGFGAATIALRDAGIGDNQVDPERFGVVFGGEMMYSSSQDVHEASLHCMEDGKFEYDRWGTCAMKDIYPLWLLKYLPNMTACHLTIRHNALGPNNTVSIGEMSSMASIVEAAHVIARGHADVMMAGATGSRLNITSMLVRGDKRLSHRNDEPAAASRPFDADRDGMVIGEGAGCLILESRQHAESRGARILARILGEANTMDTNGTSLHGGENAFHRVIRQSLARAGVDASEIGHVNADGLSTVEHDQREATAIRDCLGDVPVTAPKSYFGNLGAGGGAVEAAASVLALTHGEVPATLNYSRPDPRCPINVVHGSSYRTDKRVALLLNQSCQGQVGALVIAGS